MKFSDLKIELNGVFWGDHLALDKLLFERHQCPHCKNFLAYYGTSNQNEYRAYGVCENCDFAKHFWTESVEFAKTKKAFSSVET